MSEWKIAFNEAVAKLKEANEQHKRKVEIFYVQKADAYSKVKNEDINALGYLALRDQLKDKENMLVLEARKIEEVEDELVKLRDQFLKEDEEKKAK